MATQRGQYAMWVDVIPMPQNVDTLPASEIGTGLGRNLQGTVQRLAGALKNIPELGASEIVSHATVRLGNNLVVTYLVRPTL